MPNEPLQRPERLIEAQLAAEATAESEKATKKALKDLQMNARKEDERQTREVVRGERRRHSFGYGASTGLDGDGRLVSTERDLSALNPPSFGDEQLMNLDAHGHVPDLDAGGGRTV
jgi:hypothetical protein